LLRQEGMMDASLLVVGGDSTIGVALSEKWSTEGGRTLCTTRRRDKVDGQRWIYLDLAQSAHDLRIPFGCESAVVCTAETSLARCRQDPIGSRRVNVENTLRLTSQLVNAGCFVVFLSTGLVFDGSKPLRRSDEPVCPMTEYGRQKADAERAILTLGNQTAILRLTKVFHPNMSLLTLWRGQLAAGEKAKGFSDYICSPIRLDDVTRVVQLIATNHATGIWQLSGTQDRSYADIAVRLAIGWGFEESRVENAPAPKGSLEHRPRFSTLDSSRLQQAFAFTASTVDETIDALITG
jgi:dTDP-4-dehydrorhamnose reductase